MGYGSPSVTWSKDGAVLVNNSQVTIFEDQVTRGGFTFAKSVLQLCVTQDVNSGQYSCNIEGIQMNDSATFELSVAPSVGMYSCSMERVEYSVLTVPTAWIPLIFGKILCVFCTL